MTAHVIIGDARKLPLPVDSVDLVVTSPPYWRKRDYGHADQIGQESTPAGYVENIAACLAEWCRVLRPHGSVFLNVGDTYHRGSLVGVPALIEQAATAAGWLVRNRIIWAKPNGMPDPARNRLTSRHEYVIHLTRDLRYHYDLFGYAETHGSGANPGDVWPIAPERNTGSHLAPFPAELARRAIVLAAPRQVCGSCGAPEQRLVRRTGQLDTSRPQARRALELATAAQLTDAHIAAIQATGISDAGKAQRTQAGTGNNSAAVRRLAAEAKSALGGYFREFTFAKRATAGWSDCGHAAYRPGVVLDPFSGTGTTARAASALGRRGIGIDLSSQ